jgi:hypothetical protein
LVLLPVKVEGYCGGIVDAFQGSSSPIIGAKGAFESGVVEAKGMVAPRGGAAVFARAQDEKVCGDDGISNSSALGRVGLLLHGVLN